MAAHELRLYERPTFNRPVLVAAFRGWNDGGQAATLAAGYLARLWSAEKFADIDPEHFVDFQATRPLVSLDEGRTRRVEWPENAFFRARIPDVGRDAILLIGVEPNYRWRTFTEIVAGLASDLGVEMVVTLGALLADVPHTRPSPVTGAATDPKLVDELGLQLSRYEGPTGIVGVLLDAFRRVGIPSVSLWAAVPHYVSLAPSVGRSYPPSCTTTVGSASAPSSRPAALNPSAVTSSGLFGSAAAASTPSATTRAS